LVTASRSAADHARYSAYLLSSSSDTYSSAPDLPTGRQRQHQPVQHERNPITRRASQQQFRSVPSACAAAAHCWGAGAGAPPNQPWVFPPEQGRRSLASAVARRSNRASRRGRYFVPEEDLRKRAERDRCPTSSGPDRVSSRRRPAMSSTTGRSSSGCFPTVPCSGSRRLHTAPWNVTHIALRLQDEGATMASSGRLPLDGCPDPRAREADCLEKARAWQQGRGPLPGRPISAYSSLDGMTWSAIALMVLMLGKDVIRARSI
jgi:hypothetical protein